MSLHFMLLCYFEFAIASIIHYFYIISLSVIIYFFIFLGTNAAAIENLLNNATLSVNSNAAFPVVA